MRADFFRPLDICLLAAYLAAIAASLFLLRGARTGTPLLVVNTPDGEFVYPLDTDRTIPAAGALGMSTLVIRDGRASFAQSPCPNKDCLRAAAISRTGEWAACLPNRILIRIESAARPAFDAMTG
ncbi:MAG: NusG domain II-containing protein [Treponemataceae bacterium]|nr:NusG domain II-containing protein [Treponemataceae bacterium]